MNDMFTASLFLGFPLSSACLDALKLCPERVKVFVSDLPDSYLNDQTYEGIRYFGKFAAEPVFISDLYLLEKNIYSILSKIIPNYPYQDEALVLLAIPSPAKSIFSL